MNDAEIMEALRDKNHKRAYAFAKEISAASAASDRYYAMLDSFAELLEDENSYVRTRGACLICAQARWDGEGRIGAVFEPLCALLREEKPTAVRQCLKALREVLLYRPELSERLREAVRAMDMSRYPGSMAPLIRKDADELLKKLE